MRRQMLRLLHWLGALATPVVVLSATLDPEVAGELVAAYRGGAGTGGGRVEEAAAVQYPGWLFAARDGAVRRIDERDRVVHARQTDTVGPPRPECSFLTGADGCRRQPGPGS
ncbi:hypothetical protein [Streptomyces sp. NBC_00212]|uniref:hypothetical protein n=1 Tax=Streptomyces sp. NBC_00212 TaxID=2975684 RepID=UPI00325400AA